MIIMTTNLGSKDIGKSVATGFQSTESGTMDYEEMRPTLTVSSSSTSVPSSSTV